VNVPILIAQRYFRSKNKRNIITIISNISMIGVAVGTAALIIVLSVFNGLEELVRTLYGKSDPNLVISATKGKAFDVNKTFLMKLENTPGVALLTEVIEDNALLQYHDRQMVVKMRGLSDNYFGQSQIDANIREGDHRLRRDSTELALVGAGVQHELSITLNNRLAPMRLLYPRNTPGKKSLSIDPSKAFNEENLMAGGVFLIEQHIDDSYIFVPLTFAQRLLGYGTRRTALYVKVGQSFEVDKVKEQLREQLGPQFKVQDSDEQHVSLFKAIKVEKLFVFITFTLILLIASLNIFFSLSMLVIDKKKDISVLLAMGASQKAVRRTFLYVGAIVALVGAAVGLVVGVGLCWLQQRFGFVSMGMATSVVDAYPVKIQASDVIFTCLSIIIITVAVSIRPALNASHLDLRENL
jgi:lipoprotein-releasing system permease protein